MQHPTKRTNGVQRKCGLTQGHTQQRKCYKTKGPVLPAMPGPWNIEDEVDEAAHWDPAQRSEARAKQSDEKGNRYHTAPTLHKLICNGLCL